MKYVLFLYDDEMGFHSKPDQEKDAIIGQHMAYVGALTEAGAMAGGEPLDPPSEAVMVRRGETGPLVEDGPYLDSKEQLGGFYVIEAADLDAAISWAAKCPTASSGRIEIRPVWSMV